MSKHPTPHSVRIQARTPTGYAPNRIVTPVAPTVPERYEQLLTNLAQAEREWEASDDAGRCARLEEASSIVFELLYGLDFKQGGELVPRLAGLYGYIASELLAVGKTRDRARLIQLRDMITTLRQSWYGSVEKFKG